MHKLDLFSVLKFIAFLRDLPSTSLQKVFPIPSPPNKMSEINQKTETLKHG